MEREMWNKAAETMDRRSLKKLQLERLRETVTKAYGAVPFYNKLFKEHHVSPDDIRTLEDLVKLPMISKIDLRDNYPYGMLAVPRGNCVRIHASSGTTGKPTLVCYTKEDVSNWSEVMARSLFMAGLRRGDAFQVTPGYGLFTGGLGFHYGGERLGAMVVPTGTGNTIRQINLMRDLGTNMIAGIASYALHMAEVAGSMGVDLHKDLQVRRGIFGAEVWSDGLRKKIASLWDMDCYDIYGMSEMYGPGAASECSAHEGIHVWDDHFIIEVIDPETGEVVGPEEEGDRDVTTMSHANDKVQDEGPLTHLGCRQMLMWKDAYQDRPNQGSERRWHFGQWREGIPWPGGVRADEEPGRGAQLSAGGGEERRP